MEDCIFCKVVAKELPSTTLYEDSDIMIIKDINPQAPVHWLVMPKKHVSELVEGEDELLKNMFVLIKKIIKQESIKNYRVVSNGRGAALIDHLHIHVLGSIDKFRKL